MWKWFPKRWTVALRRFFPLIVRQDERMFRWIMDGKTSCLSFPDMLSKGPISHCGPRVLGDETLTPIKRSRGTVERSNECGEPRTQSPRATFLCGAVRCNGSITQPGLNRGCTQDYIVKPRLDRPAVFLSPWTSVAGRGFTETATRGLMVRAQADTRIVRPAHGSNSAGWRWRSL